MLTSVPIESLAVGSIVLCTKNQQLLLAQPNTADIKRSRYSTLLFVGYAPYTKEAKIPINKVLLMGFNPTRVLNFFVVANTNLFIVNA